MILKKKTIKGITIKIEVIENDYYLIIVIFIIPIRINISDMVEDIVNRFIMNKKDK